MSRASVVVVLASFALLNTEIDQKPPFQPPNGGFTYNVSGSQGDL